jgi:acetoin:2,6-dichlorophenolindophenol oxidoreductase subunit alpha
MATAVRKKRGKASPSTNEGTPASNPLISDAKLKQLYATMLQCRLLSERFHELHGVKGKSTPVFGGEAAAVGAALDLRRDDWLAPLQNDVLGKFIKGMPLASIFTEIRQSETAQASTGKKPSAPGLTTNHSPFHILPGAANPAAQLNLASGVALALQARNSGNIVMAFCGDTSDSGQRWQEALTFAGKHCLPLLVLVHTKASTKSATAKKKAPSVSLLSEGSLCELPVIPVDADDVVAIYRVAFESIHKARHGGGPTLIHAVSLPRFPHTKTPSAEHPDAIAKMEAYLAAKGLFSPSWKQKLIDGFNRDVNSALQAGKKHSSRNRE